MKQYVSLSTPLNGINDYKDVLNLSTGEVIYKIKKVILTGEENWVDGIYPLTNTYLYYLTLTDMINVGNVAALDIVCTHFPVGNYYAGQDAPGIQHTLIELYFRTTETTLESFKQWLADQNANGTPVILWYILATPMTSTITVHQGLSGTVEGFTTQTGTPSPTSPITPSENYINSFLDKKYKEYGIETDVITDLPKIIYADGTNATVAIKGNMSQSGTPTPTTPIYPSECGERTDNLFDKSNPNELNAYFSEGVIREGNGYKMVYIPCEPNTKYTVSKILTYRFSIAQFDHLPTYGSTNLTNVYRNNDTEVTLTTEPTAAYLVVFLYTPQDTVSLTDIYNSLVINKGNPHSYEPYGYKLPIVSGNTTTNIYLSEPLRKIGEYADTIAADGTVTRKIKKLVLTGEENWFTGSTGTSSFFTMDLLVAAQAGAMSDNKGICSHFINTTITTANTIVGFGISGSTGTSNGYIRMRPDNVSDISLTDWKRFLADQYSAGTPVTVWYILATPTTETTTTSAIPTTAGGQTFDVDTSLKPSEVDLTYHGWHEHEAEKRENGQWV